MYMTVKKTASTYKTLTINAWNALVQKKKLRVIKKCIPVIAPRNHYF